MMPASNVDMENALRFYSFPLGPVWQILGQCLDQPVALSFKILKIPHLLIIPPYKS